MIGLSDIHIANNKEVILTPPIPDRPGVSLRILSMLSDLLYSLQYVYKLRKVSEQG